ncbi:MAG: hypothetical protein EOP00_04040 [Pedobacter sp.]|nr:MAG: hypothetical protein EOP00_04040 [Pedobacter sp.]
MKKLILLSFVAVLAIVALSSFVRLNNTTENKLAKNKDFINWVTGMTNLKAQIEKSNTKTAFIKYLERKTSSAENKILANKLGYANEAELTTAFKQINIYKNSFIKATPELQINGQKLIKEALQEALQEVPNCWERYTIASMNCFSGTSSPAEEQACEEAAWNVLLNCVDPPIIP